MKPTCVIFMILSLFGSILHAEDITDTVDIKSKPVPITIPDVLDLPVTAAHTAQGSPASTSPEKVVLEKAAVESSAAAPVQSSMQIPNTAADTLVSAPVIPVVGNKQVKIHPVSEAGVKNFLPGWGGGGNNGKPSIEINAQVEAERHEEHQRPHSTARGVCSRLCEKKGRGFLYVNNDECWCRCVVPDCPAGSHGGHGNGYSLKAIPPALRNSNCRDHCRSIHYQDSSDGFYDRERDKCVCQCSPCSGFDRPGEGHSRVCL